VTALSSGRDQVHYQCCDTQRDSLSSGRLGASRNLNTISTWTTMLTLPAEQHSVYHCTTSDSLSLHDDRIHSIRLLSSCKLPHQRRVPQTDERALWLILRHYTYHRDTSMAYSHLCRSSRKHCPLGPVSVLMCTARRHEAIWCSSYTDWTGWLMTIS
jgi:hypothetical protein